MEQTFLRLALVLLTSGCCHGNAVTDALVWGAVGESVTFPTSVTPPAKPFISVAWSVNGSNIITSTSKDVIAPGYEDRITLERSTGVLKLKKLVESDSGDYELNIIPDGGVQIIGFAELRVLPKPSRPNISCPTTDLIENRSSVNLTCDADDVITKREWFKDGRPLTSDDRITFYEDKRVLSIKPVNRGDNGTYLCNVSHQVSFETAECNVKINYGPEKPTIDQEPEVAVLEKSVSLTCSADSVPVPNFSWTFRGEIHVGNTWALKNLDEDHLGEYTCNAFNPITQTTASSVYTLKASAPSSVRPLPWMVTTALGLLLLLRA